MTKEQLIALGLGEELAIKVAGESKKELEGYVERAKYLELETEKNQLAESNKSLTKNLEEVKKNVGDNEELKKQISDMQEAQKAKDKEYADNIEKIRLDNALDIALMSAGAKNNKAVKALLNLDGAKIGEDGKVVGLSKLARTVEVFARRLQLQEQLTGQIADALMEHMQAKGAIVMIEAEHMCMTMRGIKKPGSQTVTLARRGVFETDPALEERFFRMLER